MKIFDSEEIRVLVDELKIDAVRLNRQLTLEELKELKVWKKNEIFIKEAVGNEFSRPTVIDLGRLQGESYSYFYDALELDILDKSGRSIWNPMK